MKGAASSASDAGPLLPLPDPKPEWRWRVVFRRPGFDGEWAL